MKLTEVRRNAFAMPLNDPAYPPGPLSASGSGWREAGDACAMEAAVDRPGNVLDLVFAAIFKGEK